VVERDDGRENVYEKPDSNLTTVGLALETIITADSDGDGIYPAILPPHTPEPGDNFLELDALQRIPSIVTSLVERSSSTHSRGSSS
jgi:hypothetical protein